jgi:magnesium-transporting ATPase (P-type)
MDPIAISAASNVAAKAMSELLAKRFTRPIGEQAQAVLETDITATDRVRDVFADAKSRLRTTWALGMIMTVVLLTLMIGMAMAAVAIGIITGESAWGAIFGGLSVVSLLTVVVWKPFDKAFEAADITQRLEIILVGLEEEWAACKRVSDPEQTRVCIRAANQAALGEMAKLRTL